MDKQRNSKNGEVENNVFRRMICKQIAGDIGFDEENVPCNTPRNSVHSTFGGSSGRAVASTSGSHNADSVSPGEYVRDPGSILSLQPWIFKRSGSQNNEERMHMSGSRAAGSGKNLVDCFRDAQAVEVSARSPGLGSGPGRGCGALRSRRSRRNLMKPLVPIDNSYVPHLYSENFEIEECTFAPVPSPASARPFIVTDGRRIISKSLYEPVPVPFNIGLEKEECKSTSMMPGSVIGIAPLPELKKLTQHDRESHTARLGLSGSQRSSKSYGQAGLRDRLLLFSTGLSIGILSSSLSNKEEFDKLKGTLKRMENLVQDLQDELEMKEGLTVKELPNESSGEHDDDNTKIHVVDPEPMSKIEAELEAELARLELNITSKRLEEETSDSDEVDQEFIGDIVRGELKVDMIPRDLTDYTSESDNGRDSRESSPDYTRGGNYPVSPRDLSIRLHKVIQHRLGDRIKELESALAQRQKQAQLQMMATERIFSERICSNSESGSSSNQESPVFIQETSSVAEPYCLNLSGDALEAYDEAYEEFMRIADSPCTTSTNGKPHQVNEDYLVGRGLIWGVEDSSRKLKEVPTWEQVLKSVDPSRAQESDGDDEDESDNNDDDSKVLIQQIVERTKQGSPVLINAQKFLFSVDQ
ncbi:hypothetical protein BAE44_0019517 [Dichanthelium oligosanthes]|uniref:Protein POLAR LOCALIZATION DURING ASYMMETRIC DIVISION AND REDISTRIBUTION n=1 Tax=Dichanthelium oligosanthes TaxID=888268 RepID=A0A1E5V2T6_9POAL|nr:hypothetical protein BAE44_0019517 [Dichanthelium oligosanthes]